MDVKMNVPAIEKLIDYAASGIGSVIGPILASWMARREADTIRIAAQAEADVQIIQAQSKADTLQIIAKAQSDARAMLVPPGATVEGELDIAQTAKLRVQFQEEKRERNIRNVLSQAAAELSDESVPDNSTDHDWTARFFNDVQDVSSEQMQSLWAKVLAGEIRRPQSTSIKTLSILKNLDQATAKLFRLLCSISVTIGPDSTPITEARVPSLGGNPSSNCLQQYGLDFGRLNVLNEHGLIISNYNSWCDYKTSIGYRASSFLVRIPFGFQGRFWVLVPTVERNYDQEFRLSGVALTRSGMELLSIVGFFPVDEFVRDLSSFFEAKNLRMTEVNSPQPSVVTNTQ